MSMRALLLIVFLLVALGAAGFFAWRTLGTSEPIQEAKIGAATPETLADQVVTALNSGDEAALRGLSTGFEIIAETLRDAALNEVNLTTRLDLTPQQRLTVLALRDQHSQSDLRQLDTWSLVTARPDPTSSFFEVPQGQQVYLTGVRLDEEGKRHLDAYFGLQPQSFPLVLRPEGWLIDLSPIFNPEALGPVDVALAEQVLAAGGDARAWLEVYARLSNQAVDQGLLQLP